MSNIFSSGIARLRGAPAPRQGSGGQTPPAASASQQSLHSQGSGSSRQTRSPASPSSEHPSSGHDGAPQLNTSVTNLANRLPPLPNSPSLAQTMGMDPSGGLPSSSSSSGGDPLASYHLPSPLPLWLNPNYAKHIVKGNFMTLSARPKSVEQGEWLAHHVVEHYRNLWNFVRVIHEKEEGGKTICNPADCPKMSAGINHSFTWLNSRRQPVELPAYEYITLMQRWISGKIDDPNIFPTDASTVSYAHNSNFSTTPLSQLSSPIEADWVGKRSGFPEDFFSVCQTIFRQMFRVYAHLYWAHFVKPFYHLNLEKQLNSCFSHFVLTATALDMLKPIELEPMQPLIDLWAASGTFPPGSRAYELANLQAGRHLLQLAGVPTA